MASLSAQVDTVKRSRGQNAIAAAAYNSRSKLELNITDKETNVTVALQWDYSNVAGLAFSKIYAPEHAPEWVYDREKLWNAAEQAENRVNSTTAHKIMLPLPNELNAEQNIALLEDIVSELVDLGMVVDANIHDDNPNNIHAHLLGTMRNLVENRHGEMEFSRLKNRDWNHKSFVDFVREMHTEKVNEHYQMHGYDKRFCHKSYKERGVDLEPSVHEGPARNIKNSELVELNRQIAADNAEKIREKPSIILDVLGINSPVFTKEQIASELEKRLHAGIDFEKIDDIESMQKKLSEEFTIAYEKILNCPEITQVIEADLKGRTLYTTTKRLELEERFTNNVKQLNNSSRHSLGLEASALDHLSIREQIIDDVKEVVRGTATKIEDKTGIKLDAIKNATKARQFLSDEQKSAVLNILNGKDISVLEGLPGAGKTLAASEIVRQCKKAGKIVIGVAPSSSAALELSKATGIECKNASLWRKIWQEHAGKKFELNLRGDYYKEKQYKDSNSIFRSSYLTKKHVIIIDEASMGELANMDYFINEAKKVGAKIIKLGDGNQLSPVGWAGALDKTIEVCGSEKLEEVRRQQNPLHREATKLLGSYQVRAALDIFWKEGNIKIASNPSEANSDCVRGFVESYLESASKLERDDLVSIRSKAVGVFSNESRKLLNGKIREQLKEAGVLKGHEYEINVGNKSIKLMRGEQIVFSRNANRLGRSGIFNGEIGTVLNVKKPNKNGLANLNVLVHKANGSKEKVSINLRHLAKSRYFNEGMALDHGYAVTAHKVQGASIDEFAVRLEKGVGFEVFNVLATRHRKNVIFYADKETLEDMFYESLDKTAAQAKNRFEINAKNEEVILKGGLAKMVSKRTNTSFASDYRTMGQLAEDQSVKAYLDRSEETISYVRKITAWQAQELRKTGEKPAMWAHPELWESFKEARKARSKAASILTSDYGKFKNRLQQLNMNYATVEKHASALASTQLDKVIVEQKSTILHKQDSFKELIQSVSDGQTISIKKAYTAVNLDIADSLASIEEKSALILDHEDQMQELVDAISHERHYRKTLLPEYLNRIFKTKSISKPAGVEALEKYKILVNEHGHTEAAKLVTNDITRLGALKGIGFGTMLGIGKARGEVMALSVNLENYLISYGKSGEMIENYNKEMKDMNFGEKMFVLREEIEHLRSLLPNDLDNEFLEQVGDTLKENNGTDANISWKDLQQSAIFDAVRIDGFVEKRKDIVENDSEINIVKAPAVTKVTEQELKAPALAKVAEQELKAPAVTKVAEQALKAPVVAKVIEQELKAPALAKVIKQELKAPALAKVIEQGLKAPVVAKVTEQALKAPVVAKVIEQELKAPAVTKVTEQELKAPVVAKVIEQALKAPVVANELKTSLIKTKTIEQKQSKFNKQPSLTFVEVRSAVNASVAEKIFRNYAHDINPTDKVIKSGSRIKVGSLNMSLQGDKVGLWQRFSASGSKGDIFSFVEEARSCSKFEALEIVASHAGVIATVKDNNGFSNTQAIANNKNATHDNVNRVNKNKDEWIAKSIVTESDAAFKQNKDLFFIKKNGGKITHTHEYRNKDNQLLGYAVRVEEIASGKKQVLPVAYCHNEAKNKSRWKLKGFSDNGCKPIYRAEKLAQQPNKPVLIVEGEKTADAAQRLLPNHTVISWMGGAQGVNNVNWSILKDKMVTIWPDNDNPGKEAAHSISSQIDQHNGFSGLVSTIDTSSLNLPEKWDLADKLPKHLAGKSVPELLKQNAITMEKTITANLAMQPDENIQQALGAIDILEAQGRIDQDKYLCKKTYHATLVAIAANKNINLQGDPKEFVDNIRTLQSEYNDLQRTYDVSLAKVTNTQDQSPDAKTTLENQLVANTAVLQMAVLNKQSLTEAHTKHIQVSAKIATQNLKQFADSDKEHAASNMHKQVSSKEWRIGLENDQTTKADLVNSATQEREEAAKALELALAIEEKRNYVLGWYQKDIDALDKIGHKFDKDILISKLKSMSLEERQPHMSKLSGAAVSKYADNLLKPHVQEKQDVAKSNDLTKILKASEKQQDTYVTLFKDHFYGISKACEVRDNNSLILTAQNAHNLEQDGGMSKVHAVIEHAVMHKFATKDDIVQGLEKAEDNVFDYYKNLQKTCVNHHATKIDQQLQSLEKDGSIKVDTTIINNKNDYLNHVKNNTKHEFLPLEKIDHEQKQQQQLEQEQQQEQQRQADIKATKDMDDFCL